MASRRYHPYKSILPTPPTSSSPPPEDANPDSELECIAVAGLLALGSLVQDDDDATDAQEARSVARMLTRQFPAPCIYQAATAGVYKGYFSKPVTIRRASPGALHFFQSFYLAHFSQTTKQLMLFDGNMRTASSEVQLIFLYELHFTHSVPGRPSLHPVYQEPIHILFKRYDLSLNIEAHSSLNIQIKNYDTTIGRTIRAFNSTLGITCNSWRQLVDNSVRCTVCLCCFSAAGFLDHLDDDECKNWYTHNKGSSFL